MAAKEFREEGDYGDFVVMKEEDAVKQLANAKAFYKEVKNTLDGILKKN